MARDYLAAFRVGPNDKLDFGVKGMKWGVRRSRSTLRAEAAKRETSAPAKKTTEGSAGLKAATGEETSSARYARLAAQAKEGRGSEMSDTDLKFFNARTEALSKINKLNQEDPSWLAKTTKKVIQTTAERQMQSLSDTLADKYIGKPIGEAIKGKAVSAGAKS